MIFKLVELDTALIGGHYAVQNAYGRYIGAQWRLDRKRAEELRHELEKAFEQGRGERVT